MKKINWMKMEPQRSQMPGAEGVSMRVPISVYDEPPNYVMRIFTIQPGGHTPYHSHEHEHEILVLSGRGYVKTKEGEHSLEEGDCILIYPNEEHGFFAAQDCELVFACIVPLSGCPAYSDYLERKKSEG